MQAKINRKLSFVIPLEGGGYVYSTPISREVFEMNFLVLGKIHAAIHSEGLSFVSGPRVAGIMLKQIAASQGFDATPLINEMRRLSMVLVPTDNGYDQVMLEDAVTRGMIDEDGLAEIDNYLAFFTAVSAIHTKQETAEFLEATNRFWKTQSTSLSCMDFITSLRTSTPTVSTGEKSPT